MVTPILPDYEVTINHDHSKDRDDHYHDKDGDDHDDNDDDNDDDGPSAPSLTLTWCFFLIFSLFFHSMSVI